MYKEGEVTISKSFRNEDITHKPKRFQNANVAQSLPKSEEEKPTQSTDHIHTLEGAIAYFEANSSSKLNKLTCSWLKEYREMKFGARKAEVIAEKEGEENE